MINILNTILQSLISNFGVFKNQHYPPKIFLRCAPEIYSLVKTHALQMVKGHYLKKYISYTTFTSEGPIKLH